MEDFIYRLTIPTTRFSAFGTQHFWVILVSILFCIGVIWLGKRLPTKSQKVTLGLFVAAIPLVSVFIRLFYFIDIGAFDYKTELPLYICRILVFFLPVVMITQSQDWFGVLYFWILGGTLNALITPDQYAGFPHITAYTYWLLHSGLVVGILYALFVFDLRPKARDIFRAFIIGNIYIVLIHIFNLAIGANYSYTIQKPPASILDYFGPWPLYLLTGQLLAMVIFAVLYIPFWIRDRKNKPAAQQSSSFISSEV